MGFLTRETNSPHASSSRGPAQRQTTSFRDKDEYRVGLGLFDILLVPSESRRRPAVPNSVEVARTLSNLGIIARERGDLQAVRDYFSHALSIYL
jgi:hypothetical protein